MKRTKRPAAPDRRRVAVPAGVAAAGPPGGGGGALVRGGGGAGPGLQGAPQVVHHCFTGPGSSVSAAYHSEAAGPALLFCTDLLSDPHITNSADAGLAGAGLLTVTTAVQLLSPALRCPDSTA